MAIKVNKTQEIQTKWWGQTGKHPKNEMQQKNAIPQKTNSEN